jgi:putative transcriptional regulator
MSWIGPSTGNLTGSLLVAHPSLQDPNFRRTILFLSHHSADDGALGLVLNRPLKRTLGEPSPEADEVLHEVDLFYGGPVGLDHITIASLQWRDNPAAVAFQSFMGNVESIQIGEEWRRGLRAFVGYAGWSQGQLEGEIAQKAWIVLSPTRELIEMTEPEDAWKLIMRHSAPHLRLLAEAPDDPELN